MTEHYDGQAVIRAVNRAEDIRGILAGMARIPRRQTGGAGGIDPGAPIDLGMMDLADSIQHSIQQWALLLHEEQGDPLPADRTADLARFLREHAIWIAGGEWVVDLVEELRGFYQRGIGMLKLLPARTRMPEPCECGKGLWVIHERPPIVRCDGGHVSSIASHLQARGTESVTQAQAAWVLGCTAHNVSQRLKRGSLARGPKGVRVDSLREALADAAE